MQQNTFLSPLKQVHIRQECVTNLAISINNIIDTYNEVSLSSVVDDWVGVVELFHHVIKY